MPKYENGIIYKLKHNEDYDDINIYVGSTTNFKNRKNAHKTNCNCENNKNHNYKVYQYIRDNGGWDEWVMIPIEQYSCNNKKDLETRERHHIDLLRPALNKNIPLRTNQEYRDDNKEIIKIKKKDDYINNIEYKTLKQKIYNENHKEEKKIYDKEYRLKNKDKINERKKEYDKEYRKNPKRIEWMEKKIKCDNCNCEVSQSYFSIHKKTKKCINFKKD